MGQEKAEVQVRSAGAVGAEEVDVKAEEVPQQASLRFPHPEMGLQAVDLAKGILQAFPQLLAAPLGFTGENAQGSPAHQTGPVGDLGAREGYRVGGEHVLVEEKLQLYPSYLLSSVTPEQVLHGNQQLAALQVGGQVVHGAMITNGYGQVAFQN
ncbi:MAG: hypothetical protein QXO86_07475 [Nitrososphaerota archaeon]